MTCENSITVLAFFEKTMKRILTTSLILIIVPVILFLSIYLFMVHSASVNAKDYSTQLLGSWVAFQYYQGSERYVCDEINNISIEITNDEVIVLGSVLPQSKTSYQWYSGTAISFNRDGENVLFYFSLDDKGILKLTVADSSYIILLRKSEGTL